MENATLEPSASAGEVLRATTQHGTVAIRPGVDQGLHFQGPSAGIATLKPLIQAEMERQPGVPLFDLARQVVDSLVAASSSRDRGPSRGGRPSRDNRTYSAKPGEVDRSWFVVDASGYNLGRLATRIATVLRGKHKPTFTPHVDTGDFVVVINAAQVQLSGAKLDRKHYHRYSGYPGGLRSIDAATVRHEDPDRMIRQAVRGMLPKNLLSRKLLAKLKVYADENHPHAAQKPQPFPSVL